MQEIVNMQIRLDYIIIFILAYTLATIITYKLMKGWKEAENRILEIKK